MAERRRRPVIVELYGKGKTINDDPELCLTANVNGKNEIYSFVRAELEVNLITTTYNTWFMDDEGDWIILDSSDSMGEAIKCQSVTFDAIKIYVDGEFRKDPPKMEAENEDFRNTNYLSASIGETSRKTEAPLWFETTIEKLRKDITNDVSEIISGEHSVYTIKKTTKSRKKSESIQIRPDCDFCGALIQGAMFFCLWRKCGRVFCVDCESKIGHDPSHPLLRLSRDFCGRPHRLISQAKLILNAFEAENNKKSKRNVKVSKQDSIVKKAVEKTDDEYVAVTNVKKQTIKCESAASIEDEITHMEENITNFSSNSLQEDEFSVIDPVNDADFELVSEVSSILTESPDMLLDGQSGTSRNSEMNSDMLNHDLFDPVHLAPAYLSETTQLNGDMFNCSTADGVGGVGPNDELMIEAKAEATDDSAVDSVLQDNNSLTEALRMASNALERVREVAENAMNIQQSSGSPISMYEPEVSESS